MKGLNLPSIKRNSSLSSFTQLRWIIGSFHSSENVQNPATEFSSKLNVVQPKQFYATMRNVPSPVTVVTTIGDECDETLKRGITCSSFTSVSSDPAIISFCINQPSRMQSLLDVSKHFAVHVLADDQVNFSIFFSKPSIDGINQFESVPHTDGINDLPIIENVAAVLQCEAFKSNEIGDHVVWYGIVNDCYENEGKAPLLYYDRKFRNLGDQAFMDAFERSQLKFKDWTHEAHLRMAWNYLRKYSKDEASPLIRNGIKNFNNQHQSKIKKGYHETITTFYIHFVAMALNATESCSSFEEFIMKNEYLLNKDLLFIYYTKETLFSDKAKKEFVRPDKKPLP